ncbi:hypothetical protein ES703_98567 [subsurface metagenome]
MLNSIKQQLSNSIDHSLVERLLERYTELKQNYYLGKYKPSELDAGHFAEVVIRILQFVTVGTYTRLGQPLNRFDAREVERYAQLPSATYPDSIRIHIPRVVFAIYGIRNRRGVGHVGGDVNPNLSDASFIVASCDWIMAEILGLYYTSTLEEAQQFVDTIVIRKVPLVQDFNGFLKVLAPRLSVPRQVLVLLYQRGASGASRQELGQWVKTKSTSHIPNTLARLEHEKGYIHCDNSRCFITRTGIRFVEENICLQF